MMKLYQSMVLFVCARGRGRDSCDELWEFGVALKLFFDGNLMCLGRFDSSLRIWKSNGFVNRRGKESYRNFLHPSGVRITLSGAPGDDAKHYQEPVREAQGRLSQTCNRTR